MMTGCSPAPRAPESNDHPTIVSLNPCSDAVLADVADPSQILAISHFSRDPASSSMELARAKRFRAVSGSAEEVLALGPDIVVADEYLSPATRAALHDLGIRLVQLPIVASVAQGKAQVRELARLAGHPGRGEALVARIDTALAEAAPQAGSGPVSTIVWQAGGIVPGKDTLIADLLRRTGFVQAGAARRLSQADYLPLEAMLADPPRLILAAGDPRTSENRLLSHPALAALRGTRRARFDPSLLWCGGPTIIRAAERLKQVREGV